MDRRRFLPRDWRIPIVEALGLAGFLALLALFGPVAPVTAQPVVLRPLTTIGAAEGPAGVALGVIGDVASDRAGNVYVLDMDGQAVHAYAPDGRFLGQVAGRGRGPGELYMPSALGVIGDRLYVLNPGNQRVDVFLTAGGAFAHVASFRVPPAARGLCVRRDAVFVLAREERGILHQFTPDGRAVASWGRAPGGDDALLSASLTAGHLGCDGADGTILYLPSLLPQVWHSARIPTGYRTTAIPIPGYLATEIRSTGRGEVTFGVGATGRYHVGAGVVFLRNDLALVQIGEPAPGARSSAELGEIRSFLYDLGTRRLTPLGQSLPRLTAIGGARAYAVRSTPFPQVNVYALEFPGQERIR